MAVTVTYLQAGDVFLGSTTPPTVTQAQNANSLVATVLPSANGDAGATITHQFGFSSTQLQKGFPNVDIIGLDTSAAASNWYLQSSDPNWIGLGKVIGLGADTVPQIQVRIARPNTLVK
jgi:hypothetical protein